MKDFENRLTFGEVMGKSLVSCFLTHTVYIYSVYDATAIRTVHVLFRSV